MVKKLYERQIKKKNEQYVSKANKDRRHVIFEPGYWVWVHIRKEIFIANIWSKLQHRRDDHFQVIEWITDNAYKLELSGKFNVVAIFNVSNLSLVMIWGWIFFNKRGIL